VTAFSESQIRQFAIKKLTITKRKEKELAKTRLLKLSKTSCILMAFCRHNTESQKVKIVTVTMGYVFLINFTKTSFVKKNTVNWY
jgi:hypothetical protein